VDDHDVVVIDPTFTIDCPTQLDPDRGPDGGAALRVQPLEMPITPDDIAAYNPNTGPGDPYGGAHDLAQSYLLRPLQGQPGHHTSIDGLYQLGAGTWPGHGVNGGSGYIVAQQLLRAANA
jgi:hypothetical protein